MRILLLLAAIAAASQAQNDCSRGACYPPTNDLLLGRAGQLQASSTCGLTGSEIFCTPYQQRKMKCCPCDSRNPNSQLAHTVKEVLSTSAPDRWWQSRKDPSPVTLQLDLQNMFQLDNLVLSFKGPRPSALVIERTLDNGRTWQPALYMATNCQQSFPGVPTATPLTLDRTYCYTLPPTGTNPYQDHRIEFSPLRQYAYVSAPDSQKIEDVSGLTGLRVRLMELGDVPRLPGRALSRFYALKEMKVMGSCMCHGHANRCLQDSNLLPNGIQVHPQCDCQHNTAGVNCERCADLYNDLPWRPAVEGNTHTCKRCECNNHAERCHFDQAVYEASGRRSGGVCDGCMHHTTGPKCDQCAPGYQPNPRSRMDRPDACIRCVCSAEGTVNGGRCDDSTSSCQCKANVEGPRCDRCKRGYHSLSTSNPLGCTKCSCFGAGSLSDVCDQVTGQCSCRPHFHGLNCDKCSQGYWRPFLSDRCEPCGCDPTRSSSDSCDQLTGQCRCRPGFGGRTCTECPDNTYGDPLIGCQPCRCNTEGTLPGTCDKQTGFCLCRPGVTGVRCDSCSRGHCDSFPACEQCPSCFFTLDARRQNFSLALERLSPRLPTRPGGTGDFGNFGPRFLSLETRLNEIRNSISLPPNAARQVDDALFQLDRLRDRLDSAGNNLSPLVKNQALDPELDKLQTLLDSLILVYKAKKGALDNSVSPGNAGDFTAIKDAYDQSTDAAKKADGTSATVRESANIREEAMNIRNQVQPKNTRDLDTLNNNMASKPDLTPVANKVCGSVRTEPCTPLQCEGGDLCPSEGVPPCDKGDRCVGALPLSKRATADTRDVKDRLANLTKKITEAAEKLQKTQDTTNQVRQSTEKLSSKLRSASDELEDDLKDTRAIVTQLKDFLSDPSSDLTHVQNVSDFILQAKLPRNLASLKKKLEDLKNLAANLPDSTKILEDAQPQLDAAKKLLEEAQDARDTAVGVKADVDGLLEGFRAAEGSESDLEQRLSDTMDMIDKLNNNLTDAENKLTPAEKNLIDLAKLINDMKPQMDDLKQLLQDGKQQAEEALEKADLANDKADEAENDLLTLEKQFENLKGKDPGTSGNAGVVKDRLAKMQKDTGALVNTTDTMMKALEGKADSLRRLQGEILQKSTKLEGLDAKMRELLENLRYQADRHTSCIH
ncbi:laminin subunit beta-3-like [Mugil cephalus]|uniref:laminin subunit beta-3-like n=1 Tax=Mugil cephalus TaxID=48193 RepID=UPI001FB7E725|nr:laminin subunit beta-3-like [Mugil cephalus]